MNTEIRASIFTKEQEAELKLLKSITPYRIVWGEILVQNQEFRAHTSYDRRALNRSLRAGNLVATIG